MAKRRTSSDSGLYQKTILKDGLRVVTERMPSVRSISLGVWIDAGSRNETTKENGLSHLIEHMAFKGTKNRTAREIASSLESIGGLLNAFTSKEHTCYIARILDEHLDVAVDVLADLTCNATLTATNLGREKKVVCEEIKEARETPSDHIHDVFASAFWGEHPLGRPIMGSIENITNMPRTRVTDFIRRHHRAGSIVIAASGSVPHRRLVRLVKEKFHFAEGAVEPALRASRTVSRSTVVEPDDNKQLHLCLGYPGLDYASGQKMAALALNAYLGGGMSSVLFQRIREEKGLAYTVYSYHDFYRDTGVFTTYLATDKGNLIGCIEIALRELRKMKKKRLSEDRLEKVKAQLKGTLTLGMESTSSRMNRLARHELMLGSYQSLKQTLREIDKVTPTDVLELARRFFDDSQLAVAVLGPADKDALDDAI